LRVRNKKTKKTEYLTERCGKNPGIEQLGHHGEDAKIMKGEDYV